MRTHGAGLEVHHTIDGVEQPDVGIPFVHRGRVLGVAAGNALNGRDGGCAGELGFEPGTVGPCSRRSANATHQVLNMKHDVFVPASPRPGQPSSPGSDVAPVLAKAACKDRRQPVLGSPGNRVRYVGCIRPVGLTAVFGWLQCHLQTPASAQETEHVKGCHIRSVWLHLLCQCIGGIPALRAIRRRHQDFA